MSITAKLFMSGRSQAIRLPAKLRLDAKEVRIEQIGSALWVQPEVSPGQSMAEWLAVFYETSDALPDNFLADRKDSPPQTRTGLDF
ncbi:AbrB/MazE/SpoVT family DNA-binding domain-containing protein [Polaromonas sp. P1-6]|nr:AbrB/MazE/SpoVT family DNA-binding domain-containing protein [Polaromonas sp. P1-6]